eukprot:11032519-Alexandrium_andersonii.AAC.1
MPRGAECELSPAAEARIEARASCLRALVVTARPMPVGAKHRAKDRPRRGSGTSVAWVEWDSGRSVGWVFLLWVTSAPSVGS